MSKDQVVRVISFETEELWPHQKRETFPLLLPILY